MSVGTKETKWKDLFLVLEEDAFLREDRYMDSHRMTPYVPITIHANMLGHFPGLIYTQKIHMYWNSGSLHWECRVLSTGPPGKAQLGMLKEQAWTLLLQLLDGFHLWPTLSPRTGGRGSPLLGPACPNCPGAPTSLTLCIQQVLNKHCPMLGALADNNMDER